MRQSLISLLRRSFMATHKISDYTVGPTEEFFFDTNVWIFVFAPIAGSKPYKQKMYSRLLKEIRSRNACLWINSLVIAEYVNAVLRLEFKQWVERNQKIAVDFKHDFRPTSDYQTALTDIKGQVTAILGICQRRPDDFNALNIENIITSMGNKLDFGDSMIVDMCQRYNLKLVTDDKDIIDSEHPFSVLTA